LQGSGNTLRKATVLGSCDRQWHVGHRFELLRIVSRAAVGDNPQEKRPASSLFVGVVRLYVGIIKCVPAVSHDGIGEMVRFDCAPRRTMLRSKAPTVVIAGVAMMTGVDAQDLR